MMYRRVWTGWCATSTVLFIALLILCCRSYAGTDFFRWRASDLGRQAEKEAAVLWSVGTFQARWRTVEYFSPEAWSESPVVYGRRAGTSVDGFDFILSPGGKVFVPRKTPLQRLGFGAEFEHGGRAPGSERRTTSGQVWVPSWLPAALAVLSPAVWVVKATRRRRRASRQRAGLCPACGYDLRASSGRCPECGAKPAAALLQIQDAGG
jgi:hypothetical protein